MPLRAATVADKPHGLRDVMEKRQIHEWLVRPGILRPPIHPGAFPHTAYTDFEIAAGNLLASDPRRVSDCIPCYALYTDPPLGRIGMTDAEVRKTGRPALFGRRPMTRVARAVEKGESQGFMKVAIDPQSKPILGAAIL